MKKIIILAVAALLAATMVFGASAFQWDDIDAVEGDHLWFFVGNSAFFSWDGLFQAGLNYGTADGESLKFPASAERQMISVYYNQYNDGAGWPASLDINTKAYTVFVLEYKSAAAFRLAWLFEYAGQTGAFNTTAEFEFPASEDWDFAYIAIPSDVERVDRVLLSRLDVMSAPSDVEIKRMGFFKSEDAARTYLKDVPATDDPATDDPAVPTAD